MKPLYEYTSDYERLIHELEQFDELTVEQLQLLDQTNENFSEKAKNVGAYIKNLEIEQSSTCEVIDKMNERVSKINRKIENLKNYLKYNMEKVDIYEIKSSMFDIRIKQNPCHVKIIDENKIENIYIKEKITKTIDRELIKSHLKEGIELGWAILEKEKRVEIK